MSAELYAQFTRRDLERSVVSPETRFRHEWRAFAAAERLARQLQRERGRLEVSSHHPSGCCAGHAHA